MEKKETEMVLTGKTTSWIASKQGEELVFPFGIMFDLSYNEPVWCLVSSACDIIKVSPVRNGSDFLNQRMQIHQHMCRDAFRDPLQGFNWKAFQTHPHTLMTE